MKNVVVVFASILLAGPIYAAGAPSLSMDVSKSNSSASNRLDKNFSLVVAPAGIGPSGKVESGFVGAIYVSPKTLIQLEAGDGNTSDGFSFFGTTTSKVHSSSTSLSVKHFVGNSFYVKGGVDNRRLNYQETYTSTWSLFGTPSNYEKKFGFEAESWSGSVVIGNQWQWNNFTLGCDWIGVAVPFSSKVNSEFYSTSDTSTDTVKRNLADEQKHQLKDVAYQGVKFYLGASF